MAAQIELLFMHAGFPWLILYTVCNGHQTVSK